MDSILPLISNSSYPFDKPFDTVPSAPTTIGITVTIMSHIFFFVLLQDLSICLSFPFLLFSLSGPPAKSTK